MALAKKIRRAEKKSFRKTKEIAKYKQESQKSIFVRLIEIFQKPIKYRKWPPIKKKS